LFLKPKDNLAPIPDSHYKPVLKTFDAPWKMFPWRPSKDNTRPMVKQQRVGGDLVFWYLKPHSGREDYFHAPTRDVLPYAMMLTPLVRDLQNAMRAHLPGYYQFHMWQASKLVLPPDEIFVQKPWKVAEFQQQQLEKLASSGWGLIPGANAFSTLTLNKTLLFGAHDDGSNMPYTYSCITALGDFVGGYLAFPRLGIGFDVQPYDVLISDTNYEHHCSGRIVVGNRYTIVAYLQKKVDRRHRIGRLKNGEMAVVEYSKKWKKDSIEWWMNHMSHVYSPVQLAEWEAKRNLQTTSTPCSPLRLLPRAALWGL
jgi:2-oxoglutarate-Fe(II)-dependent dioxygenase family protein